MKTSKSIEFSTLPKDYSGLFRFFMPRPIKDKVHYDNTVEVTDAMVLWEDEFTEDQEDYFDLLCKLIEDYDAEHVKWRKATGLDALKHLMEEHAMTGADLSKVINTSRNLGAMILRGERSLTVQHIAALSRHFGVNPGLFVTA